MILVDANLLVYAHVSSLPQHQAARKWLDDRLNESAPVGLPWPSLLGFARLVTNPRIFERPRMIEEAWRQIGLWLDVSTTWIPAAGDDHRRLLGTLLPHTGGRPNLIPDAHLATLAIEHGLILCSSDGDFARFPGLRWMNPLAKNE